MKVAPIRAKKASTESLETSSQPKAPSGPSSTAVRALYSCWLAINVLYLLFDSRHLIDGSLRANSIHSWLSCSRRNFTNSVEDELIQNTRPVLGG